MPNSKTPQELIVEIERKDRLFRITQSVFMIVLLMTTCVLIFFQFQVIQHAEGQITTIKEYLRCSSLTPIQDRTPDFVDRCFDGE